ncbi:MAG: transporter substrate-binding domain-containing protein, partial [Muribaculaceae bacterium]|nr:transporter substrate-binding domain-containing protein [Muribaculaceae bacterium]
MKKLKSINGRMPLLVGGLALVLALMWALGRCSSRPEGTFAFSDRHPEGDTVHVAIEMSPLLYSRQGDSIVGLDYEIIRHIAAAHNLQVSFRPFVPLHFALEGLEAGTFDVVVAALPATTATRERYHMT